MKNKFGFEKEELATLRRLTTTEKIQAFLDEEIRYNKELYGATCRSPRRVLRDRVAHCIEGALFAAAALRCLGYPPVIVDLEAVRDDDHVIAIFKKRGHWGAIAKSNYAGLRFREPVYRSLRELVMSYFEHYYNLEGEKTLRTYSRPVQLARFDSISWMTTEKDLWPINDYLCSLPHRPLLTPAMLRKKRRMDARLYRAGLIGTVK
jgi:hypothetical protein